MTVGTAVSVGTGVNAATMACTVARTSTGVGVTGGGWTHAAAANDVKSKAAVAIEIFIIQDGVVSSDGFELQQL